MRTTRILPVVALIAALAVAPAAYAGDADEVVGYVGDTAITLEQLHEEAGGELTKIRQQEFEILSRALTQVVNKMLLEAEATAQGQSLEEYLTTEVKDKLPAVTDQDIAAFYEGNKARMGGRTLEDVSGQIGDYLNAQKRLQATEAILERLRGDTAVRVLLDPPRARVPVPDGAPSKGPEDAAVTLVEFSDFQCPYCKRAHPTVERILAEYGDRIRFVYRDYPLPNHPRATPAAVAALCAGEQGKYWEYHEHLMTVNGSLDDADLTQRAGALELDAEAFSECVASDRHAAAVRAGLADGQAAGVSGTPAFFINGRLLSGAQPFEALQKVVEEELARTSN